MKRFFVVNPQSANGETGRRWPELSARLSRALGDFEHAFTRSPFDAVALTRKALREGAELVVAVGGDGTVNEVANGFFEAGAPLRPGAALGVLPRGTGGDFKRTYGWRDELDANIARLGTTALRPLDVGHLRFTTPEGQSAERYFVNVCSFGISGLVDQEVNRSSKALGGKLSFMLASARALLRYSDRPVELSFDGGPFEAQQITAVAAGIGRYFGGGMKVAPEADPADGLFDVTVWSGYGLGDFVFKSRAIYEGTHVRLKGTRTLRCRELSAKSESEVLLDVDGEQPGRLPCTMSILPGALRLQA